MLPLRKKTSTPGYSVVVLSNLFVFISTPAIGFAQSNDISAQGQTAVSGSIGLGGSAAASTSAPPQAQATAEVKDGAKAPESKAERAGTAPAPQTEAKKDAPQQLSVQEWRRRYRKYNSWYGPTGGILLVDPASGAAGSARIQLVIDDFSDRDFLNNGDRVDQVGQTLSFGWTATELVELFGSLRYLGTVSDRPNPDPENDPRRIKEDKHVMGDLRLGLKVGAEVEPLLGIGADLSFFLPNQVGGTGPLLNSLGVQIRFGLASDLRNLENKIPLVLRLNLGYLVDNSAAIVKGVEDARYKNLTDPLERKYERRHFVTRFERLALNINREDQLLLALGIEAPLEVATDWYLHPMVEWQLGFPFNRQDFVCPDYAYVDWYNEAEIKDDRCQAKRGMKAYPQVLTAGLRGISPIRGLSALIGVEIGLTGTSKFVRELVPAAPYRFLIGIGYDYDARPPEVRIVERKVKHGEDQVKGRIRGVVLQQGSDAPLPGAGVSFIGRDLSPIQTAADGTFVSYPFLPGTVEMEVSHPDFQRGGCTAFIPEKGGDVEAKCYIIPQLTAGQVTGTVVDQWGSPIIRARVDLTGPENVNVTSDQNGQFQKQLAPGEYQVHVDADGYLVRNAAITVPPRQTATARFVLVQKSTKSTLELKNNEIQFKEPIKFVPNSTEISGESVAVIAELADFMQRSAQIRRVKIWGSATGAGEEASISLIRALAIKRRLVESGVAPDRIDAVAGDSPRVKVTVEQ